MQEGTERRGGRGNYGQDVKQTNLFFYKVLDNQTNRIRSHQFLPFTSQQVETSWQAEIVNSFFFFLVKQI